ARRSRRAHARGDRGAAGRGGGGVNGKLVLVEGGTAVKGGERLEAAIERARVAARASARTRLLAGAARGECHDGGRVHLPEPHPRPAEARRRAPLGRA